MAGKSSNGTLKPKRSDRPGRIARSAIPTAFRSSRRDPTWFTSPAHDNQWTLGAIDWSTGESRFHYAPGGARFNSFYPQPEVDADGRVMVSALYALLRDHLMRAKSFTPTLPRLPMWPRPERLTFR